MAGRLGFGEMIRQARTERGWTQTELGERVEEAMTTISNWETERIRPSIEQGNALVIALGLSAEMYWRACGVVLTPPAAARLPRTLLEKLLALPPEKLRSLEDILPESATDGAPRRVKAGR